MTASQREGYRHVTKLAEASAAERYVAANGSTGPFLQVAALGGAGLDVVLGPVDGGAAVEVRAAGVVQHEVGRLGRALAVDEVAVWVVIEPPEESAIVVSEDVDAPRVVGQHRRLLFQADQ